MNTSRTKIYDTQYDIQYDIALSWVGVMCHPVRLWHGQSTWTRLAISSGGGVTRIWLWGFRYPPVRPDELCWARWLRIWPDGGISGLICLGWFCWCKGPCWSQDWNPLESANDLELETVKNNPQCLVESYKNLLKEYWSYTVRVCASTQ